MDNISNNGRIYTDMQGLQQLRYNSKSNPEAVKKEVAKQFESILIQMMLRSMRDANKSFASGLFNSDQMEFYQDIFDKQLSLVLSNVGMGFAESVEKNIDQHSQVIQNHNATPILEKLPTAPTQQASDLMVESSQDATEEEQQKEKNSPKSFANQEEFVTHLWPSAKVAAGMIGTLPEILLAQAALETNWGKKIIPHGDADTSHNLFNIKADSHWTNKTSLLESLEQVNGVLVKEKSSFRKYDSFKESFLDYAKLLKENGRYSEALKKAINPKEFIHALQNAGYATDSNYAEKVLKIFSSNTFQDLIAKMK